MIKLPISFYRGQVIDAQDPDKRGKVGLYIPEIHGANGKSTSTAIWAMPANSPISGDPSGGSNVNCGSIIVPPKGTEVLCFEERQGSGMWYYLCGPMYDNSNCAPVEAKVGSEYEKNYVLFKSPKGRAVIVSDESSNQAVVIKGKGDGSSSKFYDSSVMAVILEEGNGNAVTIQSGKSGQFIKMDKSAGEITIQNGSGVYIKMTSDGITMKAPRLDLN